MLTNEKLESFYRFWEFLSQVGKLMSIFCPKFRLGKYLHTCPDVRYWSKVFCYIIPTRTSDLEVKDIDLEKLDLEKIHVKCLRRQRTIQASYAVLQLLLLKSCSILQYV